MRKNLLIGQSGGPTAAINASLAGAVKRAMKIPLVREIYGSRNGIEGVIQENIIDLRRAFVNTMDFELLKATPSAALGSCRYKLPDTPGPVYEQISDLFRRLDIGFFLYIGGNDSMDTVLKLSDYFAETGQEVCCVGIPKTIDNDLPCTDHTPGFGSAARYVAMSVAEIACDSEAYDIPSVTVVEVMGRNAGWLTAASVLARRGARAAPHMICLPETPFDAGRFFTRLRQLQSVHQHVLVAVSEGIRYADGEYVCSGEKKADGFGHESLSGAGKYLESRITDEMEGKTRSVELNVLQRSAGHLRSETDIAEAYRIGAEAAVLAVEGKSGVMAMFRRVSDHPYLIDYGFADIREVANIEKTIPADWIDAERFDVREKMIAYLQPLILNPRTGESIPEFFSFKDPALRIQVNP